MQDREQDWPSQDGSCMRSHSMSPASTSSSCSSYSDRRSSAGQSASACPHSSLRALRITGLAKMGGSDTAAPGTMPAGSLSRDANVHVLSAQDSRSYRCSSCGCGTGEHPLRRYRCAQCKRGGDGDAGDISRRMAASIMMSMADSASSFDAASADRARSMLDPAVPGSELRRDKTSHILCPHNVRLYRCVPCGGTGICEHGRRRYYCVPCGGGGICEHKRRRDKCHDCKRCRSDAPKRLAEHSPIAVHCKPQPQQLPSTALQTSAAALTSMPSLPSGHMLRDCISSMWAPGCLPQPCPDTGTRALQQQAVSLPSDTTPAAATTRIESMLKHWSQSLLLHACAPLPLDSLAGSLADPLAGSSRNKRGPYAKTFVSSVSASDSHRQLPAAAASSQLHSASATAPNHSVSAFVHAQPKGCNCKHSHCLKRYCECFAAGVRCNERCRCLDCRNDKNSAAASENSHSQSLFGNHCVDPAFPQSALEKKFHIEGDAVVHSKGCNCKHSHCLKRYCECHAAGARCTARCRCLDCLNQRSLFSEHDGGVPVLSRPDAAAGIGTA
jgi:hypothetical protein